MNFHERDRVENGGSGVLVTQTGHVEVERTPSFRKWRIGESGERRFRIGGSIGKIHKDERGPWEVSPAGDLDALPPIDLKSTLSARSGVRWTMGQCGYAVDFENDYTLVVRRGDTSVTLTPLCLAWCNDAGQIQEIGTPVLGKPCVVDEDGIWVPDALGPGLDYGFRLWPDMVRPVVRINDPAQLMQGMAAPKIHPTGLRLCKILSVGWSNGQPSRERLFTQAKQNRSACKKLRKGVPDERVLNPGRIPIQHSRGNALWFHEARAWDDENGYALTVDWQRYGAEASVALGLPAESVAKASGALCIDTTMAEEQVGASADDAAAYYYTESPTWSAAGTTISAGYYFAFGPRFSSGLRFTPPIPVGATVSSAALTITACEDRSATTVNTKLACEATANAAAFSDASNWASRFPAGITVQVAHSNITAWTKDTAYTLADIASPVGAVIALAGWAESNGLVVFWHDYDNLSTHSDGCVRRGYSYDGSTTKAAKLNATYTEAAAGQPYALRVAGITYAYTPYGMIG